MDCLTRISEFIEKRSSKKSTKEDRPASPWWRRFSRFRKFFIRKKKTKVSPFGDKNIKANGNSTPESRSRVGGLIRKVTRRNGLFRSKSESFVKDHRAERPSPVDQSRDSGIADTYSGEDTVTLYSQRKNIAWPVSFLSDGVLAKNQVTEKESSTDPKVLWKLVNADSSKVSNDEWISFHSDDAIVNDEDGYQKRHVLSNNLQSLKDYSEEMAYMIHRANGTWSKICRGPFPHLMDHSKDQVVEMMSRGSIDNTDQLIAKFDSAMKYVYDLMQDIDDHFGLQVDFKDRIQHDRYLKGKRPGRINLAKSYLKPKGFPTSNYTDSMDMVVEDVTDDATTDN